MREASEDWRVFLDSGGVNWAPVAYVRGKRPKAVRGFHLVDTWKP